MREQFPIFSHHPQWVYLDSAATAQKPQRVIDALTRFYTQDYATVHRAVYTQSLRATEQYHATRAAARAFINAAADEEILFTRGTTDSLNLVALSYGRTFIKAGDEILVSQMEHHSNLVPWQMLAQSTQATLRCIPINEKGELLWEGTISPRTKIVAITHMSNVTGTINPIAAIVRGAHAVGAVVVVDGAQAAPHIAVDVQKLGCDFYAFSGHKCYGPTGIGILYGKKVLLEQMPPVQGGGDMIERVDFAQTTYAKPPLRFEAGTPSMGSAIALRAAFDFIEEVGKKHIAAHEHQLLHRAEQQLQCIPGLHILGRCPDKGPMVTFFVEGVHPLDLATLLDTKNIAVRSGHLCAQPLIRFYGIESAVRASFAIYNTAEEVDLFVQAVQAAIDLL